MVARDVVLIQAAARAYPNEACGLLYGDEAVEITNVAPVPTEHYVMDPDEVAAVHAERGAPDGMWHSHPGGSAHPSGNDLEFHPPGYRLVIVTTGEVHDHGIIP